MENNLYEGDFETRAFTRLKQLKLLKLSFVKLEGSYKEFPKQLRWLCWHGFHLGSIPNDLSLEMLIVLDMQYSNLKQVWKGNKFLPSLKILDLSHSKWISRTPNFSEVPNLETLILKGCVSLVYVCESIVCVERLAVLDLSDCKSLRELPRNICRLRCLEKLLMSGCSSLYEFPMGMRSMESLKEIYVDKTRNDALIPLSREVQQWDLPGFLVNLSLGNCNLSDASFPRDFNNLPFLEYLNLGENLIRSLLECIRTHNRLMSLGLFNCSLLQSVEGLPSTVQYLCVFQCKSLKRIETTSNSLGLYCLFCYNLVEVEGRYKIVGIENVDKRIIKNLGLLDFQVEDEVVQEIKVHYEFGIFITHIPRTELVGSWFDYIDKIGSTSVSFIVPPDNTSKNRRIQALNVCHAYEQGASFLNRDGGYCIINNATKALVWVYGWPRIQGHTYKNGIMLSHWRFGNLLEAGDHVGVEFDMAASIQIKEIGLKVVYEEDDDDGRKETTTS